MSRWVTTILIIQFLLAMLWLSYQIEIIWIDQADCKKTEVEYRV